MIGCSVVTDKKHKNLLEILKAQYSIVQAISKKYSKIENTFHYIELTAGAGFHIYEGENRKGSTLLALQEALSKEYKDMNFEFHIFEQNKEHFDKLMYWVNLWKKWIFPILKQKIKINAYNCSCEHAWKILKKDINTKFVYGLMFVDPNGYTIKPKTPLTIPVIDILNKNPKFKTMDIILNVSGTAIKRIKNKDTFKNLMKQMQTHKKYWYLNRYETGDKWQWSMNLFTNWPNFKFKKLGFYDNNSEEGQDIIYHINYTEEEKKNHWKI